LSSHQDTADAPELQATVAPVGQGKAQQVEYPRSVESVDLPNLVVRSLPTLQSHDVFEVDYATSQEMIGISTSCFHVRGRYDGSKAENYNYTPNDFFYLPNGVQTQTQSRLDYTALIIGFPTKLKEQFCEEIGSRASLDEPRLAQSGLLNVQAHVPLISDFIQSGGIGGSLRAESIVHLIMEDMFRTFSQGQQAETEGALSMAALNRVIEYIDTYTDEKINIEELASQANVSRFHFSRLFKTSTGLSPYQYVVKHRIDKAKAMLRSDSISISEVSFLTGFSSQSHFSEVFRKVVGTTPGNYRRRAS